MGQEIYKDRESMQEVAIHFAKEHGCNYNLILHNPVDGEFGDGSTYETVTDSYFEKDRPYAILLTKTDDIIPQRANEDVLVANDFKKFDGFDEELAKLNKGTNNVFKITNRGTVAKGDSYMDFEDAPDLTDDLGRSLFRARTSPVRTEPKIQRNSICPKCDSGKKFKKCCGKLN